MKKKDISFSMIKKFAFTEKTETKFKPLNKVAIITDKALCKISVKALFDSIGCRVVKVNSANYKPEQRMIRNNKVLTGSYKKFIINFSNDIDILNIIKDINEKKINFLY